jgi:PAS domain S-box-containing protein
MVGQDHSAEEEQQISMNRRIRILRLSESGCRDGAVRRTLGTQDRFEVHEGAWDEQLLGHWQGQEFDVVIQEVEVFNSAALRGLEALRRWRPSVPVLVVAGRAPVEFVVAAIKAGAWQFVLRKRGNLRKLPGLIEASLREAASGSQSSLDSGGLRPGGGAGGPAGSRLASIEALEVAGPRVPRDLYQTLVDKSLQGLVVIQGGRIVLANPAVAAIFGMTVEGLLALPPQGFQALIHPDDRASVQGRLQAWLSGEPVPAHHQCRAFRKDGTACWLELAASQIEFQGEPAIQAAVVDVTDRKRAEEALRQHTDRLQVLSRRLLEVQEAERRHTAMELHDEIGQALTALKFNLELWARQPPAEMCVGLQEAQLAISSLIEQLREMSLDLRPPMLDTLGLLHTLVWHSERFAARFRVRVNFRHSELEGKRFDPAIETAAYRIVQEALTNVARHAGVSEVALEIHATPEALFLTVSDRGRGFNAAEVLASGTSSGLTGMRERATLLGGTMVVESSPGTGTLVKAVLPLTRIFHADEGVPHRGRGKTTL